MPSLFLFFLCITAISAYTPDRFVRVIGPDRSFGIGSVGSVGSVRPLWSGTCLLGSVIWVDPIVAPSVFPQEYKRIADANFTTLMGGFAAITAQLSAYRAAYFVF